MKFVNLLFILFLSNALNAQYFKWAKLIGSTQSGNKAFAITTDERGYCYALGVLDDGMMISKIDNAGNTAWNVNIPRTPGSIIPRDIGVDENGNVYTTGRYSGTIDFDPDTTSWSMSAAGFFDAFVLKLDSTGDFVWVRGLGGAGTATQAFGLDINPNNGHVVSTGYVFGDSTDFDPDTANTYFLPVFGNDDSYISELDASGNFVSAILFGRLGQERSNDVSVDKDGSIYTIGNFHGNVDFDPGPVWNLFSSAGFADAYINKLDSAGNHVWTAAISGTGQQQGHAIAVDDSGNVYTAGIFDGSTDFDPDTTTFFLNTGGNNKHLFLSKLNADGSFAWAHQLEVPVSFSTIPIPGWHISLDGEGNVYTTGKFAGTVDFDPGPGQSNLTSAYSNQFETFILKLTSAGQFDWAERLENISTGDNLGVASAAFSSGEVVTIGEFDNSVDFDPSSASQVLSSQGSTPDIYIQRMFSCLPSQSSISISACDSMVSPSGKYTWYNTGNYIDTLIKADGCDSIINLALTVDSLEAMMVNNDTVLLAQPPAADTYQWILCDSNNASIPGATASDYIPLVNGNYAVIISNGACTDTSDCSFVCLPTQSSINISACDSLVSPSGKYTWYSTGSYSDTLINAGGCDSIINLTLTVDSLEAMIVNNDTVLLAQPPAADAYQWIFCDSTNVPIPGATGSDYVPLVNGNYAVIISTGACTDTSDCSIVQGIGLYPVVYHGSRFQVYPNPTPGLTTISFEAMMAGASLVIRDFSGKSLFVKELGSARTVSLDLGFIKPGVYLVELHWENGIELQKLTIRP